MKSHLPGKKTRLTFYIGFLIKENKQSQTIKSYISAIRKILKENNIEINENKFLFSALTKACKLNNARVTTRLPIQKGMLKILLKEVHNKFLIWENQPYLHAPYTVLFSTAYFGLFRIGELTKGTHPILAKDVHIARNKQKMLFILRTSKTHGKYSMPQTVKINSRKHKNICRKNNRFILLSVLYS